MARDIKRLEHREHLQQRDAARTGRRHRDNLVSAVRAPQRFAFRGFVRLQIRQRDRAFVLGHRVGNLPRCFSGVEFARPFFLQPRKRGCEVRLLPHVARFPERAGVQIDLFRFFKTASSFACERRLEAAPWEST